MERTNRLSWRHRIAQEEAVNSPSNPLPGVPHVESPLFPRWLDEAPLTATQREVATSLNRFGFALIDFPDDRLDERSERIKARMAAMFGMDPSDPETVRAAAGDLRIQDAWRFDEDVRAIAANPEIVELLSTLYGRRAFPFQTLNFPVGTQQSLHSDAVHFSSIPERFMCGVWVALEDVRSDAGPLVYLPGSHKWPILSNALIGRCGWGSELASAQSPYEDAWQAMIAADGLQPERFLPRKGQALIWAANLLHGGDRQLDRSLTRWSQVSHYYFERCVYYTPAFSDEPLGRLDLRSITNAATGEAVPNLYGDEEIRPPAPPQPLVRGPKWWRRRLFGINASDLPDDFDAERYRLLNPDVETSGMSAADHYFHIGRSQGRRYSLKPPLLDE